MYPEWPSGTQYFNGNMTIRSDIKVTVGIQLFQLSDKVYIGLSHVPLLLDQTEGLLHISLQSEAEDRRHHGGGPGFPLQRKRERCEDVLLVLFVIPGRSAPTLTHRH